jgi:hypothetical protein
MIPSQSCINYIDQFYTNFLFGEIDLEKFRKDSFVLFKKLGYDISSIPNTELLSLAHDMSCINFVIMLGFSNRQDLRKLMPKD